MGSLESLTGVNAHIPDRARSVRVFAACPVSARTDTRPPGYMTATAVFWRAGRIAHS
jgi:hypothetical protein